MHQPYPDASKRDSTLPLRAPLPKRASLRRKMNLNLTSDNFSSTEANILPQNVALSVCVAKTFEFTRLSNFLTSIFPQVKTLQEDVLCCRLPASVAFNKSERVEMDDFSSCLKVFFFADGCFVIWGNPPEAASLSARLSELVRPFTTDPLAASESETLFYRQNYDADRLFVGMQGETILFHLPPDASPEEHANVEQAMLAFSAGLADSVKVGALESALESFVARCVKPIPTALASGSKLPLGRADVLRLTGELLRFRADLNLHSELVDTPEIFWSEPKLGDLYDRVARALDIRHRVHIINKRLDYANELASVLRSHLGEAHGLKLEWGIIVLIAVEVAFETLHLVNGIS